jgi:hypothetical protein
MGEAPARGGYVTIGQEAPPINASMHNRCIEPLRRSRAARAGVT